ncbi:RNA-binding protein, putative [Trypanosoma brucei gambiense DAL972]|uniref:RNA-binding protein, putative n=1 Tax=Trypanosoma brucei gambiense (strain MHOM/CI/86/DAL972) TaxID=679716 RepID=C9ZUC2_TRYB9|nr:RNA-binding protein, putative [Trypanosoma brucei gambiense DAL972]CBH13009.1 RNA-binding protein, putative [Trypanosoma brucei gambiense DAL972]|eukprot:XP_011775287.1 RNA-binding protein, putative [Trypanosoma brucei gambiense DAL972]
MPNSDHSYGYGYSGSRGGSNSAGAKRERSTSPKGSHNRHYHHGSYHRYRDSDSGRSYHSGRSGDEPQYVIAASAPCLQVPSDLPVDVAAFIDLVAFYIVQGGPTAEEEIMRREANNHHFAFLRGTWKDPQQLYYRWRLYSLLQGDTLLKWRTEPFQIERGKDAYAWIPPPPISSGPECLLGACTGGPRETKGKPTDGSGRSSNASAVGAARPQPSALWLSRMCVSEGTYFVALGKEEVEKWEKLLSMDHIVEELGGVATTSTTTTTAPPSSSSTAGSSATCCGMTLEERIGKLAASLLSGERIAERMVFAVEHQKAALHLMSFILDEVVRLAYASADAVRGNGNTNTTVAARTGSCSSGGNSCRNPAFLAAARCCMCLSYLFTLNDIGRNCGAHPLLDEDVANMVASHGGHQGGGANKPAGSGNNSRGTSADPSLVPPASVLANTSARGPLPLMPLPNTAVITPTAASHSVRTLNRAVEKIMPTLIEATLLVALNTVRQYGSLQVVKALDADKNEEKPPGVEGTEGILPMGTDHTAHLHVQARISTTAVSADVMDLRKEDRDAVCMIGLLLLSWLKQLCSSWSDGDVIGSRCWSTLASKYNFLVSQTIETT